MILDANGKPILAPSFHEKSSYAGKTIGGMALDDSNPDEIALRDGLDYYDQVARNPMIAGALETRVQAVKSLWESAKPFQTDEVVPQQFPGQILSKGVRGPDKAALDFARLNVDELLDRGWDSILEAIDRGRFKKGFAVLETIWDYRDSSKKPFGGKWYIRDIKERNPIYFGFKQGRLYQKRSPWDYEATVPCDPMYFTVLSYQEEYENPYGQSLLRTLVRLDHFERNAWGFWMILLQRFGIPPVVAKVPPGTTDDVRARLELIIKRFQEETGIVIDDNQAFELLEASRSGEAGYQALLALIHKIYAIVITGNALTLEAGDVGSRALAESTTAVIRQDLLRADAAALDRAMSWGPLYYLTALNFANVQNYPFQRLLPPKQDKFTEQDLLTKAQRDTMLVNLGVKFPARYFYETYRIPEPFPGEMLAGASLAPQPISNGNKTATTVGNAAQPAPAATFAEELPEESEDDEEERLSDNWEEDEEVRKKAAAAFLALPVLLSRTFKRLPPQEMRNYFTADSITTTAGLEAVKRIMAQGYAEGWDEETVSERVNQYLTVHPEIGVENPLNIKLVYGMTVANVLHNVLQEIAHDPRRGIAAFEYETARDERVCPVCGPLDRQVHPVDSSFWTINTPPLHFHCRCRLNRVMAEN